ncbi:MAG: hypothetical protein V4532_11930 [Pseudomonadota bacterium]
MTRKNTLTHCRPSRTHGISLLFALLALAALSLAAVALVRSVDTSALVMGNLGFKQDATSAADKLTQQAITVLTGATWDRNADSPNNGYYAQAHESIDVTGQQQTAADRELVNWDIDGCQYSPDAATANCVNVRPGAEVEINGNKLRYVMFRLCAELGSPDSATNSCARPQATASGSGSGSVTGSATAPKRGEIKYGEEMRFTRKTVGAGGAYQGVYYRIVVRVIGARNTTSFVETIVHL